MKMLEENKDTNMEALMKKDLYCDVCRIQFEKNVIFEMHMRFVHKKEQVFEETENYEVHFGQNWTTSSLCDTNFNQETCLDLNNPKVQEIQEKKNDHKCPKCDRQFTKRFNLEKHIKSVHEKVMIMKKCYICDKEFSFQNLRHHIKSVHEGIKPHKCSSCDKSFSQKIGLKRHIEIVHMGIKYKCSFCKADFVQLEKLKSHTKRVHTKLVHEIKEGGFKFKCSYCDSNFNELLELRVHNKLVHEGFFSDNIFQDINDCMTVCQDSASL